MVGEVSVSLFLIILYYLLNDMQSQRTILNFIIKGRELGQLAEI